MNTIAFICLCLFGLWLVLSQIKIDRNLNDINKLLTVNNDLKLIKSNKAKLRVVK